MEESRSLSIIFKHNDTIEVMIDSFKKFVVDFKSKHYECRSWMCQVYLIYIDYIALMP